MKWQYKCQHKYRLWQQKEDHKAIQKKESEKISAHNTFCIYQPEVTNLRQALTAAGQEPGGTKDNAIEDRLNLRMERNKDLQNRFYFFAVLMAIGN
jgi:inhibitor of KinA sporulation pathway (predicted exonuclease)